MTELFASSVGKVAIAGAQVRSQSDFDRWCRNEVREFLPFRNLLCAAGNANLNGDVQIEAIRSIDYAIEHIASIKADTNLSERLVIKNWLSTRQPQLITREVAARVLSPLEMREFSSFALDNIAAHGVISPDGRRACYFSFSGVREPLGEEIEFKLRLIVPHLHLALCNVLAIDFSSSTAPIKLTMCERLILNGLVSGLTNSEIAQRSHRSPHTIKHQVASLLRKFEAGNRAEAVAKAIHLGLVDSVTKS